MFSKLCLLTLVGLAIAGEEPKNPKRSLSMLGLSPWPSALGNSFSSSPWSQNAISHGGFSSYSGSYHGKDEHYSLSASAAEVAAALAAAKEAAAAAAHAQQKVQAAREQVYIQEKFAAAKEAAAQAAIQRTKVAAQIAAAIQRSEALAAAAAAAQKSAAASAAAHFSSGPWSNSKPGYNPWG